MSASELDTVPCDGPSALADVPTGIEFQCRVLENVVDIWTVVTAADDAYETPGFVAERLVVETVD